MIACPSCGTPNRIASPFCQSCGDRIYKNGASPSPENTKQEPSSGSRAFRSALNSLLFVAVVAVVGLAFWPYAAVKVPVSSDPGNQVEKYLVVVTDALDTQKTLPQARISERNLNAYLGMNNSPEERKLLGVVLSSSTLQLLANEPLGPFNVSTRLVMKPQEGHNQPVVTDFWVGHLPLPAFWAKPWTRSLSNRFDLDVEPELWDHIEIDKIQNNAVYLDFSL